MDENKLSFSEWLDCLPISDTLKKDIFNRFRDDIINAVNNSGGYVDRILWEENKNVTKGEQYFVNQYKDKP